MNPNQPREFIEYAFICNPHTGEIGFFRRWDNAVNGNFWFETMDGKVLPGGADYWDVYDLTPEQSRGIRGWK